MWPVRFALRKSSQKSGKDASFGEMFKAELDLARVTKLIQKNRIFKKEFDGTPVPESLTGKLITKGRKFFGTDKRYKTDNPANRTGRIQ